MVRDGAALQHGLPGVTFLVAVVAVVAVVLAAAHFGQLREARHGERVVAGRVGL
jgi:ABC-type transporter Mla subunit MlaD